MPDSPEPTQTSIDTSMDGSQTEPQREETPTNGDSTFSQETQDAAVAKAVAEAKANVQQQIDTVVKKVKAKAKAKRQTQVATVPPSKEETPATTEDPPESTLSPQELLATIDLREELVEAMSKHAEHINATLRKDMKGDCLEEKPDDVDEWVTDWLKARGMEKPTTEPAPRENNAGNGDSTVDQTVKKPDPAAVDNSAPAGETSWNQIVDPTQLTKIHVDQILADKGTRAGQSYIRKLWETWGHTVRVMPG